MKFSFEKLGYIDKGTVETGNLTLICGNNNKGKTYINYAIYGFLNNIRQSDLIEIEKSKINDLLKNGKTSIDLKFFSDNLQETLKKHSSRISNEINDFFSSDKSLFSNSRVSCELINPFMDFLQKISTKAFFGKGDRIQFFKNEGSSIVEILTEFDSDKIEIPFFFEKIISDSISRILFSILFKKPFIITSERTGASLFYKELDITKNIIFEKMAKSKKIDLPSLLFENISRYAIPIKHNVDVIRDIENFYKKDSFILTEKKEEYNKLLKKFNDILNGKFKIMNDGTILFEPKKERKRDKVTPIPLYIASSASKSLLLLFLYIKSIAQPNDILMIDEPELNLHPSNQILMARILANLVNLGIDVMITTHSDFMIKEFNNLIMLSNEFADKKSIMEENDYSEIDILKPEKVKAYFIDEHKIKQAKIDKFGIDLELFDNTILKINKVSDDLYYSIKG